MVDNSQDRWHGPYRPDPAHPHHLVDDEGRHLFVLGKTAWTYLVCGDPEGVCRRAAAQGITVLRVALNGAPYYDVLGHDCWPWRGTSAVPDYSGLSEPYFRQARERAALARSYGLGLNVTLYMRHPLPTVAEAPRERRYWEYTLATLGREPNVFCWEIANETLAEREFQAAVGTFLRQHDPWERPICTSDGTTDYAAWPAESFIDLAINHTCTGQRSLDGWYRALALNTRAHGKPAWCNESGREGRHKNDDGVHRRKQGWVWCASGCYWTHHSWDGCEGIDDPSYRAPGEEFLAPLAAFWQGLEWWRLSPTFTLVQRRGAAPLAYALQAPTPGRDLAVIYLCAEETGRAVSAGELGLLLLEGRYRVRLYHPATGAYEEAGEVAGQGLGRVTPLGTPAFTDDLVVRLDLIERMERSRLRGTG